MVEDAQTAHEYLKSLPSVDPERIGVLGFSLGGGVAMISAGQHPDDTSLGDLVIGGRYGYGCSALGPGSLR
jgi:dienelactone hydrolase